MLPRIGCLVVLLAAATPAVEIEVGSTRITLPTPEGYVLLTDDMQPYADVMKRFVPSQCRMFAWFLPAEDAATASSGGSPSPKRFFYAVAMEDLLYRPISTREFATLCAQMKAHNE